VYRIDADAILLLAVFAKKTEKMPDEIIRVCQRDWRITTMRAAKRKRLEARGWKIGSVENFLDLSDQESAYIELRLKLARGLKARRNARGFSQTQLARAVQSSQSRVAKMEAGDPTVSLDLLVRSLLALGTSNRDLGRIIGHG
jgi:ribosome-binding protein aMBF1 (putative translation factor)